MFIILHTNFTVKSGRIINFNIESFLVERQVNNFFVNLWSNGNDVRTVILHAFGKLMSIFSRHNIGYG